MDSIARFLAEGGQVEKVPEGTIGKCTEKEDPYWSEQQSDRRAELRAVGIDPYTCEF